MLPLQPLDCRFDVLLFARPSVVGSLARPCTAILSALEDLAARTFVTAKLDTLEYLRRSGRMNGFMAGLGSLLQIKPILTMKNGHPSSERVRTTAKANIRLVEMLKEYQPIERFALLHTNASEEADAFRAQIAHLIPTDDIYSMDITPVIGAHIGPGAVGYAIYFQKPCLKEDIIMKKEDRSSIIATVIVLSIATGLALAGSQGGHTVSGFPVYALCVVLAFVIQWIAFIPAWLNRTEKFYDQIGEGP